MYANNELYTHLRGYETSDNVILDTKIGRQIVLFEFESRFARRIENRIASYLDDMFITIIMRQFTIYFTPFLFSCSDQKLSTAFVVGASYSDAICIDR